MFVLVTIQQRHGRVRSADIQEDTALAKFHLALHAAAQCCKTKKRHTEMVGSVLQQNPSTAQKPADIVGTGDRNIADT